MQKRHFQWKPADSEKAICPCKQEVCKAIVHNWKDVSPHASIPQSPNLSFLGHTGLQTNARGINDSHEGRSSHQLSISTPEETEDVQLFRCHVLRLTEHYLKISSSPNVPLTTIQTWDSTHRGRTHGKSPKYYLFCTVHRMCTVYGQNDWGNFFFLHLNQCNFQWNTQNLPEDWSLSWQ